MIQTFRDVFDIQTKPAVPKPKLVEFILYFVRMLRIFAYVRSLKRVVLESVALIKKIFEPFKKCVEVTSFMLTLANVCVKCPYAKSLANEALHVNCHTNKHLHGDIT